MATDPYYDPTTGLYILAGDNASKDVTKGINDNFDLIYGRTAVDYITHIGSEMINGVTYNYRVWNNGFCEVWFSVEGTMPNVANSGYTYGSTVTQTTSTKLNNAGYYSIDSLTTATAGYLWSYETARVAYPTSIISFTSVPSEICEVTARIAIVKTTARSGGGYNTTTQSASYGLGRFDASTLFNAQYKLNFYVCGQGTYIGS